jgi:hypothetical protein
VWVRQEMSDVSARLGMGVGATRDERCVCTFGDQHGVGAQPACFRGSLFASNGDKKNWTRKESGKRKETKGIRRK